VWRTPHLVPELFPHYAPEMPADAYGPHTALLVVDIQNDFADPAGSLYVPGGEQVVDLANREIEWARAAGAKVTYSQDWHPHQTPHFADHGGVLRSLGVTDLVVVGLALDYCVHDSVIDAVRLGLRTTLLEEGTRPVELQAGDGERAKKRISAAGAQIR